MICNFVVFRLSIWLNICFAICPRLDSILWFCFQILSLKLCLCIALKLKFVNHVQFQPALQRHHHDLHRQLSSPALHRLRPSPAKTYRKLWVQILTRTIFITYFCNTFQINVYNSSVYKNNILKTIYTTVFQKHKNTKLSEHKLNMNLSKQE